MGVVLGGFSTLPSPTKSNQSPVPVDFFKPLLFWFKHTYRKVIELCIPPPPPIIITKHNPCNQHSGHQIGDCQGSRKPSLNSVLLFKSNLCLEFYDNHFLIFLPKVASKLGSLVLPTFPTLYKWNHVVCILLWLLSLSIIFWNLFMCYGAAVFIAEYYMNISQLIHSLFGWTFKLFLLCSNYE